MTQGILAGVLLIAIIGLLGAAWAIHRREVSRKEALGRVPPPDFEDDDEMADTNPTLTPPPSGLLDLNAILQGDDLDPDKRSSE